MVFTRLVAIDMKLSTFLPCPFLFSHTFLIFSFFPFSFFFPFFFVRHISLLSGFY